MMLEGIPKTASQPLPPREHGNYATVEIIRKLARQYAAHPLVRGLAKNIILEKSIPSMDYLDECRALAQFVQENVRYLKDINGVEQLHQPTYLINEIKKGRAQGDCDDMALLLASLMLSIGHQPYLAIVKFYNTTGPYNHIYVVCYENNYKKQKNRLAMDTIVKDQPIGWEVRSKYLKEIAA